MKEPRLVREYNYKDTAGISIQSDTPVKPVWPTLSLEKSLPLVDPSSEGVSKPSVRVESGVKPASAQNARVVSLSKNLLLLLQAHKNLARKRGHSLGCSEQSGMAGDSPKSPSR